MVTTAAKPEAVASPEAVGQLPILPPHLQKAMSRVTEISSLPEITTRIVHVVEDPKATAHDMHEIVKNDPALAAKILKVVNSAFYGLPSQIASLDRAIVMLGLSAIKNIALAASLARLFKPDAISDRFTARDLWTHCVAVGVCAKLLSKRAGGAHSDESFVAGLVHDMGLLVEHQLFPEKLRQVVDACMCDTTESAASSATNATSPASATNTSDFCSLERDIIGADHQAFGAALAVKWKFPPGLRNAISFHHDPAGLRPEFRRFATIIHVADVLCSRAQLGFWLTAQNQEIRPEEIELIGLTQEKVDEVVALLPDALREAEAVFSE